MHGFQESHRPLSGRGSEFPTIHHKETATKSAVASPLLRPSPFRFVPGAPRVDAPVVVDGPRHSAQLDRLEALGPDQAVQAGRVEPVAERQLLQVRGPGDVRHRLTIHLIGCGFLGESGWLGGGERGLQRRSAGQGKSHINGGELIQGKMEARCRSLALYLRAPKLSRTENRHL